ncbi:MAG: OmpH family outer membrane protein [Pseudomonadales bacterium]
MNRLIQLIMAGLLFGSVALNAQAQTGKIAVFSPQEAILNSELAKQRIQKLQEEKEFLDNKAQHDKLRKEYADLVEELKKESAVMSASQQAEAQKKITTLRADIEHNVKKLQAAQNDVIQQLGVEVGPRVQKIVEELVKAEEIGLILRAEAVMHANASYNITSKVTDKLNAGAGK